MSALASVAHDNAIFCKLDALTDCVKNERGVCCLLPANISSKMMHRRILI